MLAGYGWDIDLEYGFHETRRGTRYTMSKRRRAAARKAKARAAVRTPKTASENFDDGTLFPEPDALF